MTSTTDNRPGRRAFFQSVSAATAALLAGLGAPRRALATGRPMPSQPGEEKPTAWVVDFLLVPGRSITLFAREADAKRHAVTLIRQEIEQGQVRDPEPILRRIEAGATDGA